MKAPLKAGLVIVGAIGISTLALQASDLVRGIEGSLTGSVSESQGPCGAGETLFVYQGRTLCVDTYEAAASLECPVSNPQNEIDTRQNFSAGGCRAVSKIDLEPWRFVNFTEAQQLCARANKRLLTNEEWYAVASGLTDIDTQCIVSGVMAPVAAGESACVSPAGMYDLVGNVWEWVDGEVVDGVYEERALPQTGYVTSVDRNGVAVETSVEAKDALDQDYVWTNANGLRGMIRGGFYGSGSDAGLYTLNSSIPLDFKTTGVGFRCVRDMY